MYIQKKQKVIEIKEIRLSPNIDTNDLNTKINSAKKFLSKGDKVKVTLRFRGREMAHMQASKHILDDFAEALSIADHVVLADIYAAREKNTIGISSKDLLKKLQEKGTDAVYFPSFDEIENYILENCSTGDVLITMGAGDIVKVGEKLLGI